MINLVDPYRLSPEEWDLAMRNADFRQTSKDKVGVLDRKYSDKDGVVLHRTGCVAEIGIGCGMLHLKPHQLSTIRGDGGHYDYMYLDEPLSIKGRDKGIHLIIPKEQWPPKCIQIACRVMGDLVIPEGWASPKDIEQWITKNGMTDLGHGPSYCVPIWGLLPMRKLQRAFELLESYRR